MTVQDKRFLEALEAGHIPNAEFKHRDHLRAAWLFLVRDGYPAAVPTMEQTIRRFAAHHRHAPKFHRTLTIAWTTFVAAHMAGHEQKTFEAFVDDNPELLDKDLVLRFYSRERLFSDDARADFVQPDLRSFPATA